MTTKKHWQGVKTMADMYDSGKYCFNAWSKQTPCPNGDIFWNDILGKFNPYMTGKEANRLCDHVGKITISGQLAFIRGWEEAQKQYNQERN